MDSLTVIEAKSTREKTMDRWKVVMIAAVALVCMSFVSSQAWACAGCGCSAKGKKATKTTEVKAQSTCPVMGGEVTDKSPYVDVKGYRVYVCCAGCISKIKAEPDKYLEKITEKGETPTKVADLCPKCGVTKGSDGCCGKKADK